MDGRRGVVLGGLFGMWRRFFNKGGRGGGLGDISRLYFFLSKAPFESRT